MTVCGVAVALAAPAKAQPADAQREFLRGLTSLHEFEYEDANEAFRRAQALDPSFVMPYWGEAMTYHQSLWRRENVAMARQALARLGATRAVRADKSRTPKEAALLGAVEVLFGTGDAVTRRSAYAEAMRRVHERHHDDPDVAALYALSLLGTMTRSLIGSSDHEGHSAALAGSETQSHVANILQEVLASHPDHRGALHYLLHDYDDPEHAPLALPAARAYSKLGSESSHARHMPAHIFLQLGMWHEAAESDREAFAVSSRWIARKGLGAAMRNYHALAWLQYELLQLGRYREAGDTIRELEPVVETSGDLALLSDLSSMRSRDAIETRRWHVMAGQQKFGNVNDLFAIGMSAARAGNAAAAETARQALAVRAQSQQEGDLRPAIAIMERELAGLIALTAGRSDDAVAILRAAADQELQLPAPLGLPIPVKPAPELFGEVLVELGRPAESAEWFERTLARNRNRSQSVIGLARAATALGQTEVARKHYRELLANFDHADAHLPELGEARAALARTETAPRSPAGSRARLWLIAGSVTTAALLLFRFVSRRRPAVPPRQHERRSNRKRRSR